MKDRLISARTSLSLATKSGRICIIRTRKKTPTIVYCTIGARSETIGEKLKKNGFTNVYNLYGGIFEWKNADFKVLNKKLSKQGKNEFELETLRLNEEIDILNYQNRLEEWETHLDNKKTEISKIKLSNGSSLYPFESKINGPKEEIGFLESQCCIITENAGQGKTNFICDFAKRFLLGNEIPSIFLTGYEVIPNDIRKTILVKLFPNSQSVEFDSLIETINQLCSEIGKPFVIIIDGINENLNTSIFAESLESFIQSMSKYSFVKTIVTCRQDYYSENFENLSNSSFANDITTISSLGFRGDNELTEKYFYGYIEHFDINFKQISGEVYEQLMNNFLQTIGGYQYHHHFLKQFEG